MLELEAAGGARCRAWAAARAVAAADGQRGASVMMNVRVICDATLRRKSRGKVKLFLVLRWVKDAGCCYFFMAGGCDACGM